MQQPCAIVIHSSGAGTSKTPRFDLIPRDALIRLADRYELGLKYGEDNWRKGMEDKAYVIERISHVVDHALKLREKLKGRLPHDGDDDAAAIMWGGAFLCEATAALFQKDE